MPDDSLDAEDAKMVTLARSSRARTGAAEGAALRDADGRTYAASTVDLPSLQVSAVGVAVAMAVSSGSRGLEAVAIVGNAESFADADLAAVRDLGGGGVALIVADGRGTVQSQGSS